MGVRIFERYMRAPAILVFLACTGASPAPADMAALAERTAFGDVRVEVEEIRHLGGEDFRVVLSLINNSGSRIVFDSVDREFSIQMETGWLPLCEKDPEGWAADKETVQAGGVAKRALIVGIPYGTPSLFRTYEGDISLALRYELRYRVNGHGRLQNVEKKGEEYYWINPDSGKWLHREGM